MSQLIDDLLKLSRITGSGLCRIPVDLSEIASEIASELQANNPGRIVNWVICPEMCAAADAGLIRIAMENLMGNAWKFSSKHGCAQIEVNFYSSDDGSPVYYVRDDGAGFDMTYAKKMFGPFQRMHCTAEFEGSGIGLATVQRIVHRHGGEIWAESDVEQGTTVYFTLN
jgi:light-regulated signal transduction histidine kinase (bacteriophytochrome)